MIRGRYYSSMEDISPVLALRAQLISPEDPESGRDEFDEMCFYALALDDDGTPAGTGRLYLDPDGKFRLGTICVLPERRLQGYGDLIARMLLFRALDLNAPSVCALCPAESVGFLLRYGMKPVGEAQTRFGVLCREMYADAQTLNLEGACHKGRCKDCDKSDCSSCSERA